MYPFHRRNFLTSRIEYVDKDELFADDLALEEQLARTAGSTFRIGAYTAGYTRDIGTFKMIETGIGANASLYTLSGGRQSVLWRSAMGLQYLLAGPPEAGTLKMALKSRGRAASLANVKVPCSRISRAARRKAPSAVRHSELPTLTRRTPMTESSSSDSWTPCSPITTFTGRSTELTTAAISSRLERPGA